VTRLDPEAVAARAAEVRRRIDAAAGGRPVTIVAVTKGFGADAVEAALAAGLPDVGENYAQELVAKAEELGDRAAGARWHMIGRLQRNKVRLLSDRVAWWQTVDRLDLAAEIARRAPGARVLVQLNLSGEEQKGGCRIDEAAGLVDACRDVDVRVDGLMGVAPAGPPEAARPGFRRLVELADELALPVRSIGMSGDLDVAVEEGSTMVRVGTAIFGPRPPRQ
jgi:pyridoxal phosphate enzyme (YggS family)